MPTLDACSDATMAVEKQVISTCIHWLLESFVKGLKKVDCPTYYTAIFKGDEIVCVSQFSLCGVGFKYKCDVGGECDENADCRSVLKCDSETNKCVPKPRPTVTPNPWQLPGNSFLYEWLDSLGILDLIIGKAPEGFSTMRPMPDWR